MAEVMDEDGRVEVVHVLRALDWLGRDEQADAAYDAALSVDRASWDTILRLAGGDRAEARRRYAALDHDAILPRAKPPASGVHPFKGKCTFDGNAGSCDWCEEDVVRRLREAFREAVPWWDQSDAGVEKRLDSESARARKGERMTD